MSKTIDERVVEMQFNNSQFEKNVATSMSTLEKLKSSLNLQGAAKGLENVNAAAKNFDMSGMGSAIDAVHAKFSALDVMGVTALANITNSAVNAGKRMVNALTLEPITTGFQEYETQINAVQTILANTSKQGTTLKQVTAALDELNTYADKTIYNFTEMTRNIGTFTAAGLSLETSTKAIQGIANLAAVSGSTSQQASTAMYQLSQALAAGSVKLMDWNSVVNAGMGGRVFQDAIIETAKGLGQVNANFVKAYEHGKSFRELLNPKDYGNWFTSDLLAETLKKFTKTGAVEYLAKLSGNTKKSIKDLQNLGEKSGYNSKEFNKMADSLSKGDKAMARTIKDTLSMANTAEDAATKVKTFSQLWDTLKETAQSGWTQTWQLIIGDFEEAKEFLTTLSDMFGDIINKFSDSRNKLLEGALSSKWGAFEKKINKAGVSTQKFQEQLIKTAKTHGISLDKMIKEQGSLAKVLASGKISSSLIIETLKKFDTASVKTTKSTEDLNGKLKEFQKVVKDVWHGDYDNGEARVKALTKAGYKYSEVQKLVNKVGKGQKITLDDLSKSQLKSIGYTDKQIEKIQKLAKEAEKSGTPINKLIEDITKPSGRELLLDSFMNIIKAIGRPLKAVGEAWRNAFPPMTADRLYNIIDGLHTFTSHLVMSDTTLEKFTRTLKGVFAILDIFTSITGGVFKVGVTIIQELLKALGWVDVDVLSITARVGDAIVAFRDWIDEHNIITKAIQKVVPQLVKMGKAIADFVVKIYNLPQVQEAIKKIADGFDKVAKAVQKFVGKGFERFKEFIDRVKEMDSLSLDNIIAALKDFKKNVVDYFMNFHGILDSIPKDILDGFANGLKAGIGKVVSVIVDLANRLVEAVKAVLGIHSPSVVFMAIGAYAILGLLLGFKQVFPEVFSFVQDTFGILFDTIIKLVTNGLPYVFDTIGILFTKLHDTLVRSQIDFSSLIVLGSMVGVALFLKKMTGILDKLVSPLGKLSEVLDTVKDSINKIAKAKAMEIRSEAFLNLAKAIGILAAALLLLSRIDVKGLAKAVGVITILLVEMYAMMKISEKIDPKAFGKLAILAIGLSVALLTMSAAVKKLASIDPDRAMAAIGSMAALFAGIAGIVYVYGKMIDNPEIAKSIWKVGVMVSQMAAGMIIMALAIKIIAAIPGGDIKKGLGIIALIELLFAGIIAVSYFSGEHASKAGSMLLKMAVAMGIMVMVIKTIASIPDSDIKKGLLTIGYIEILFGAVIMTSFFAGQYASKAGSMLLKMAVAMAIMTFVIKSIAKISDADVQRGMKVIAEIEILFGAIIGLSYFAGQYGSRAGTMILKMAVAVGLIALCIKMIAKISDGDVSRGIKVMAKIGLLFVAMMAATLIAGYNADKAGTMLIKMSAAMLLLVGSIALLSLLKPEDVDMAIKTISKIMFMFGLLMAVTAIAKDCNKTLTILTAAFGLLVTSIVVLTALDPGRVKMATTCLSLVIGMFAILVAATHLAKNSTVTLIVMTGVIAALGGILYLLASLPTETSLGVAKALRILMLSLAASFAIMGLVAPLATKGLIALGIMAGVMLLLALILKAMDALDIMPTMEIAKSLSLLLLSITAACLILAAVGAVAPYAIAGTVALIGVLTVLGAFMIGIGALMIHVPELEEFLDRGLSVINRLATGLGEALGGFVTGFASEAMTALPEIGSKLSEFMMNAMPFITGAKLIDNSTAEGVKALAASILVITGTSILEGISRFITGGSTIDSFSQELPKLGTALSSFATNLGTFDESSVAKVKGAASAITDLAKANAEIPNSGGWLSKIVGDNTLSEFGSQLPALGSYLAEFATNLGTFNEAQMTTIKCAVNAIKSMSQAADGIDGQSGWAKKLFGDNGIAAFGDKLPGVGTSLKNFANNLGTFGDDKISTVNVAVKVIKSLATLGKTDLGSAATNLPTFGDSLVEFGSDIATFSNEVAKSSTKGLESTIDGLVKTIMGIPGKISKNNAALKTSGQGIVSSINSGINSKKTTLNASISTILTGVKTKISGSYSTFKTSGAKLITEFASGMKSKKESVSTSIDSLLKNAKTAIRSYYTSFESAGKYLGDGLVAGIEAKETDARNAGYALGQKAVQGEKDGQHSASPSKDTYKAGIWFGQGLINAINYMGKKVYSAGSDMGDKAVRSLSSAISAIPAVLNSELDFQPTIRPVVDLSGVKTGANAINGMLDKTASVTTMANAGTINTIMNGRIQNGFNSDVVSAIDKLSKQLGNVGNTTYHVDGVTYDDGSNVSEAVRTLVRAAKIERRV